MGALTSFIDYTAPRYRHRYRWPGRQSLTHGFSVYAGGAGRSRAAIRQASTTATDAPSAALAVSAELRNLSSGSHTATTRAAVS